MDNRETATVNKVTILCHGVISGIISAAYLLEVIKGSRTILYFALIALLALVPTAVEYAMYRKNPASVRIRSVVASSYALLYAVAVFTTHSKLPFTYILPMLIVITLYGNIGYCMRVGVGGILVNVADVAYKALTVGYGKDRPGVKPAQRGKAAGAAGGEGEGGTASGAGDAAFRRAFGRCAAGG